MVKPIGNPVRVFFHRWVNFLQVPFFVAALALGFYGWWLKYPEPAHLLEDLFRTLQLMTLQFPRDEMKDVSWELNLARFMIPAFIFLQSYRVVIRAVRGPTRLAMLAMRRGHVIVVPGRGLTGQAMLREVQIHRLRAVAIAPGLMAHERLRMEEFEIPIIRLDPFVDETWIQMRAERAGLVIVCHGSDVDNLNILVTVAEALGERRAANGPTLVATLENETLAEQVDVALDNAARESGLRYRRLSVSNEGARAIFLEPPLPDRKAERSEPAHIVVVGLGPGARPALRHALTFGQDAASGGPRITILATDKELAGEPLLQPDAVPGYVATLRGVACDLSTGVPETILLALLDDAPMPLMACVCLADEPASALGLALTRQTHLLGWNDIVIAVHQGREDRFLHLLARENTAHGHARLRSFGGALPEGTLQRLQTEGDDKLPRAVHEHYRETMRRLGDAGGTPDPWDRLPENIRHANRAVADHMAVKVAAIGCRIVQGSGSAFAFTEDEVEGLARAEHRRWSAERALRGWKRGTRDNDRRLHPDLVPFEELSSDGQEKDRDVIRHMPEVLALAGQRIERCG